jgi:hypothetical protein
MAKKVIISRSTEQRFNLSPNLPAWGVVIAILQEYVGLVLLERSTRASKNKVLTPFDIHLDEVRRKD